MKKIEHKPLELVGFCGNGLIFIWKLKNNNVSLFYQIKKI